MANNPQIVQLREICLAYPESSERITWEQLNFRVREKMFVVVNADPADTNIWLKAGPGVQEVLVHADPSRFFRPAYVGPKGWIGVRLNDSVDWGEVGDLIDASYRLVAPKKLVAQLLANQ